MALPASRGLPRFVRRVVISIAGLVLAVVVALVVLLPFVGFVLMLGIGVFEIAVGFLARDPLDWRLRVGLGKRLAFTMLGIATTGLAASTYFPSARAWLAPSVTGASIVLIGVGSFLAVRRIVSR